MSVQVIFEDKYILCVSKPNNMVVHHARHSRNVAEETSLLQSIFNTKKLKVYPIHRLDRKTSGIILLAKQKEFVQHFQELFTHNEIQKMYYGIVRGFSPEIKIIDSPVKGRDANVHKEALTYLKTLDKITLEIAVKPYDSSRYSFVQLSPKTGRMHQLRVHMNKISHPLIGDPKYGDKNHNMMFENKLKCKNLFLHAGNLSFVHPFTSQTLNLTTPFPEDWITLFNTFSWKNPLL
ncbi:pseudouridine synthase [Polaribacter aquimarinus]|uniref:Pseudouridine synthase n=1 Tax=Polaribacter aquimarinus TaxID=2100726 RepID=A0A2U2J7W5_9FLAO|nr:pseudouridine synthase [Polaribacter aquimarinus]PWG04417.1 pseudouridine synthase [Polaribacter aquimarinus]